MQARCGPGVLRHVPVLLRISLEYTCMNHLGKMDSYTD